MYGDIVNSLLAFQVFGVDNILVLHAVGELITENIQRGMRFIAG